MIADIHNLILSRLKSEYDQYAFMSISHDYWQMGSEWRQKYFTFMVNDVRIPMAPYIKRISLGSTISQRICVPEVELLSLRIATHISECGNNMGAIIVAKIDRIREYVKMLKKYGAFNENPFNSHILIASSACKAHYDYCKWKLNCKELSNGSGPCIENKVIITTQSYFNTIIDNFGDDNYPWMIIANDDLHFAVKNKVFISNDINQIGYNIRVMLLVESITPTLNITYARGFDCLKLCAEIKKHVDKYGDSLILSYNRYNVDKYENINIWDGQINIDNTRNMPRTNKLYYMIPNNIIPIDNIICFDNDIDRYMKIFMKVSKYSRTLNILCIYTTMENYIKGAIRNDYIEKYRPRLLSSDIIAERVNMFELFGNNIFELGNFEQYALFYRFPKDMHRILPEICVSQCDNQLTVKAFIRVLAFLIMRNGN